MIRLILILLVKFLIGGLIVFLIVGSVLEFCKFISSIYGEFYGFLSLMMLTVIILFVCNRIKKKRDNRYLLSNEKEKSK